MIRLTTVSNSVEASFIRHRLEEEGIESFTTNENTTTLMPHLNGMMGLGIQIMVNEADYEKARSILLEKEKDDRITVCPHCGSENIGFGIRGKRRWRERLHVLMTLFLVGSALGNIKNRYYCRDCRNDLA